MTTSTRSSGRTKTNHSGRRLPWLALAFGPFLAACPSNHGGSDLDHPEAPFVESPALRAVVAGQLAQAKKDKSWGDEDQRRFIHGLAPLSKKSRRELSLELAGMISSSQLILKRDTNPTDPPTTGSPDKPPQGPAQPKR